MEKARGKESSYVKLARESLEHFIKNGEFLDPIKKSKSKAGVFVSLKKNGELRGCIGTIMPTTDSIEEEIVRNAVAAGTEDSRFPTVKEEELKEIDYSVDVLFQAEPVTSLDALDVREYGIIVKLGRKRGLLLPRLEGINTIEKQLAVALSKAGIDPDDDYSIERFKVSRYN